MLIIITMIKIILNPRPSSSYIFYGNVYQLFFLQQKDVCVLIIRFGITKKVKESQTFIQDSNFEVVS